MSFASTAANVEFRDIPVKFLGQEKIPRNADNERAMADFFQDKSKHKDLHGFAKEMLMSLNPRQGWLSFSPKAGGQALNISLTTLLSIAAVSTKFAFVVTDDSNSPTATIFAFQFKRRSDSENKAFLAALRRASHADPTSTTTNLPRGRAMSYTSCTSSHAHIALPGNATGNTNQPSTNLGDVTALQAKIRSLETQLVEERNKSASAEVARLSAELHRATAEREAEEARRQVESIRKEMALVAADMSSELAQMKMDFSEERALQIVQELHLIKNALSIIESNQNASSQPLWTRAANLENLKKEESSNHPRIAKMQSATDTSNAADTSNQRQAICILFLCFVFESRSTLFSTPKRSFFPSSFYLTFLPFDILYCVLHPFLYEFALPGCCHLLGAYHRSLLLQQTDKMFAPRTCPKWSCED
eukprot:m.66283 g.66283  ORF g.66283 m.66283 type:complete len:419 (-) comp13585_c0_seq3:5267-6523(-)